MDPGCPICKWIVLDLLIYSTRTSLFFLLSLQLCLVSLFGWFIRTCLGLILGEVPAGKWINAIGATRSPALAFLTAISYAVII